MSRTPPTVFSPTNVHCMLPLTTDHLYLCIQLLSSHKPKFPNTFFPPQLPTSIQPCHPLNPFSLFLPLFVHLLSLGLSLDEPLSTFLTRSSTWTAWLKRILHAALGDRKHRKYNLALLFNQTRQIVSSGILHITSANDTSFLKKINPCRQECVGNILELTSSTNTSIYRSMIVWHRLNF